MILAGAGTVRIGDEQAPVRAGHVLSRPAGTTARPRLPGRPEGLEYLAYGQRAAERHRLLPRLRQALPRAASVVIVRVEQLGYWDGEDLPAA